MPVTRYWLDRSDTLIRVNDVWSQFALENDAPHLLPEFVLGRSLWSFLDDQTQSVYKLLFQRVRAFGSASRLSLRCDSFQKKRHMLLTATCTDRENVMIECDIVAVETIQYRPDAPLRVGDMLRVCSWCNRVAVSDHEWVEIEQAIPRLDVLNQNPFPQITHGICDTCSQRLQAEIAGRG